MYFILIDDIEADRHYPSGGLLSLAEFTALLEQCEMARAHAFVSLEVALEWNANDGNMV